MVKITKQGDLLNVSGFNASGRAANPPPPHAFRGVVKAFSVSSRRRLLRLSASLNNQVVALFVTLTVRQGTTHNELRQYYNAFRESMRRAYPEAAWIWRKELHKSQTPHMHLIIYNVDFIPAKWLWDVWERCSGYRHRVDIKRLTESRQALRYVSKYMAKIERSTTDVASLVDVPYLHANDKIGRWWGVHNRENLPFAECTEVEIGDSREDYDLIRYLTWYFQKCLFKRSGTYEGNFTGLAHDSFSIMAFCEKALGKLAQPSVTPLMC